MTRILITIVLVIYNNVANLWPPFNRWAYVPANIAATSVLAVVAFFALNQSVSDLGVDDLQLVDLVIGLSVGAVAGLGVFLFGATRRGARVVADGRVAGLRGGMLAYQTLVRVPLGTALLEEFAFRGVLFAAWRPDGTVAAAVISSVVFGLWHVMPARIMARSNDPNAPRSAVIRHVVASVVLTAGAGLFLVWLRIRTGSLLAPFALHASVNSLATLAGVLAGRRLSSRN